MDRLHMQLFSDRLVASIRYSSIGAVVGATFPDAARRLRALLPRAFILVTGYGAQGATARNAAFCFNADGLGALVSSSRGITYSYGDQNATRQQFVKSVRENTLRMIEDINNALGSAPELLKSR
jgi:orotidine-5'-phosphate decarboxylase